MSDDWVQEYIKLHNQRQQEKREAQTRRRFAETGGREMFIKIREQIKQDVQAFRGEVAFQAVEFREHPSEKFQVIHPSSPWVTLDVNLDVILIKYEHVFSPREDSKKNKAEHKPGTLRVCSDLDGLLTVYRNGDGEKFEDESEVSEFLLKPLLDYIAG